MSCLTGQCLVCLHVLGSLRCSQHRLQRQKLRGSARQGRKLSIAWQTSACGGGGPVCGTARRLGSSQRRLCCSPAGAGRMPHVTCVCVLASSQRCRGRATWRWRPLQAHAGGAALEHTKYAPREQGKAVRRPQHLFEMLRSASRRDGCSSRWWRQVELLSTLRVPTRIA